MAYLPELHICIIWANAREFRKKIIADMSQKFLIHCVFEIEWSDNHFSGNMSRFYGENLPVGSHKEIHCGRGPFSLIAFTDEAPQHAEREASRGRQRVNTNTFDAKQLYRGWTGGGHMIHVTNSLEETEHDLILLLGISSSDFLKTYIDRWDRHHVIRLFRDLEGASGWSSLQHLFYVLNHTCEYVVLRNFENLPNLLEGHGDIDLLAVKSKDAIYSAGGRNMFPSEPYRVHYAVQIAGREVLFDFRDAHDLYMDVLFSRHLIKSRVFDPRGFYRPSDEQYFYSLLYHALVHKHEVSDDYKSRLIEIIRRAKISGISADVISDAKSCRALLDDFMLQRKYLYFRPADKSVYFDRSFLGTSFRLEGSP